MNGIGVNASATKARRLPAQPTFKAVKSCVAKSGKTAPNNDRRKAFAAIAEAKKEYG